MQKRKKMLTDPLFLLIVFATGAGAFVWGLWLLLSALWWCAFPFWGMMLALPALMLYNAAQFDTRHER